VLQPDLTWIETGGFSNDPNVALVRPYGSDTNGEVGGFPFLTVQAAIDAFEDGSYENPVINIGNNVFSENVSTSLTNLSFIGESGVNCPFASLTFTTADSPNLYLLNINPEGDYTLNIFASTNENFLGVYPINTYLNDITNTNGRIEVIAGGGPEIMGTVNASGRFIYIEKVNLINEINNPGGSNDVSIVSGVVRTMTAAHSIVLRDARIVENNSGVTPTYDDRLLKGIGPGGTTGQVQAKASNDDFDVAWINPGSIVFPDSDLHIAGAGYWNGLGVFTKSAG